VQVQALAQPPQGARAVLEQAVASRGAAEDLQEEALASQEPARVVPDLLRRMMMQASQARADRAAARQARVQARVRLLEPAVHRVVRADRQVQPALAQVREEARVVRVDRAEAARDPVLAPGAVDSRRLGLAQVVAVSPETVKTMTGLHAPPC
jgi:hypothetical protein